MQGIKFIKTDKLNQLFSGISQLYSELGNEGVNINGNIRQLSDDIASPSAVKAQVFIDDDLPEAVKNSIKAYLKVPDSTMKSEETISVTTEKNGSFALKLQFNQLFAPLANRIGEPEAPIVFLFFPHSLLKGNSNLIEYL